MNGKKLIVAGIALAGAVTAGVANARGTEETRWSVTVGSPIASPIYGPGYTRAPLHEGRHYQRPTRWDRDGDGIPNRYDRVYNPRWDRDGDGVPNRYDRHDDRRHDRHGDGGRDGSDSRDGHGGGSFGR